MIHQAYMFFLILFLHAFNFNCAIPLRSCAQTCTYSQNFFQFRAMSSYSGSELYMIKGLYENDIKREHWQGTLGFLPQFMQNINDCGLNDCQNISSLPFWSGKNYLTYGGHDGTSDVDPYQFGIGDVFGKGLLTLNTRIQQIGADLLYHMVSHKNNPSFYLTIRAPIGSTSVSSSLHDEVPKHDEIADAETCSVWLYYPTIGNRFKSLGEAFKAGTISSPGGDGDTSSKLYINSPLNKPFSLAKGRIAANKQEVIRIADVSIALGYQPIANDKGFMGIGFKCTFPTGNLPTGRYIFEPIFGRAGYWGIGAEILAHRKAWEHPKRDRGCNIWFKGEILHLCSGRKPNMRSFDLKANGPGSRYLLIQKYHQGLPSQYNLTGYVASYITQAVNVTTVPVISKFGLEASGCFLFDMHERNYNFAISAEVWGRSQERLHLDAFHLLHLDAANLNEFAVLGRQVSSDARSWLLDPTKLVLTLDLCEPLATINKSVDRVDGVGTPPAQLTYPTTLPEGVGSARDPFNRIPADLNAALDIPGAQAPEAITLKISGQLGYTAKEHMLTPQIALIAGFEIVTNKTNGAVNQWSAGFQGSINF